MPVPRKPKEEENLGKRTVEISGRLGTDTQQSTMQEGPGWLWGREVLAKNFYILTFCFYCLKYFLNT